MKLNITINSKDFIQMPATEIEMFFIGLCNLASELNINNEKTSFGPEQVLKEMQDAFVELDLEEN
jgi:hypothetical protein